MDETTTTRAPSPLLGAGWSDPIEDGVRGRVRAFIEAILVTGPHWVVRFEC